jgi:hypothetical protein
MFRTRRFQRDANIRPNRFLNAIIAAVALCILADNAALMGQGPLEPLPIGKGLRVPPTGELAQFAQIRAEAGPMQPVLWKLPKGGVAEAAALEGFVGDEANKNLFALDVNAVYRFRITGLEAYPEATLYPTLELLGRLNPPAGKAWDFPVEIYLPMEDIVAATRGSLVTRVVFLENSENPSNVDASNNPDLLTLDVPRGVDPVAAAQTRGRVLAIVRLGSRDPNGPPTPEDPFYFGLPNVEFKPMTFAPASEQNFEEESAEAPEVVESVENVEIIESVVEPAAETPAE